jgi:hypothetical protein
MFDFGVQLSTLMTTNSDEYFPNYSKMKQPIGKGRVRGRESEGMGADFMSENGHFMKHWQPHV